jgi:hypothetical protein
MLVRDEWESPFPDNDLTYLSLLCGAWQVIECLRALRRDSRNPQGSLFQPVVPLPEEVPEGVQFGVLAETWARHRSGEVYTANLLDAAVIYASSEAAADYVIMGRGWVRTALRQGARQLDLRLDAWTARHVRLQLDRWWPGLEFDLWQDTAEPSDFLEDQIRPLAEARGRRTASGALAANLRGLVRAEVIQDHLRLLREP